MLPSSFWFSSILCVQCNLWSFPKEQTKLSSSLYERVTSANILVLPQGWGLRAIEIFNMPVRNKKRNNNSRADEKKKKFDRNMSQRLNKY